MNECVSSEEDCHDKDAVIRLGSPCSDTPLLHGGVVERVHICKIVCHDPFVFNPCNFLLFSHISVCVCLHRSASVSRLSSLCLLSISTCSSHVCSFPTSYPLFSFDTHFIYFFVTIFQDLSLTSPTLSLLSALPLPLSALSLSVSLCCLLDQEAVFFAVKAVSKSANQSQAKIAINQRYN